MSAGKKRWSLGLATLVTAIAAWYAPAPDADGVALSVRSPQAKPQVGDVREASLADKTAAASSTSKAGGDPSVLSIRPRHRDDAVDTQLFSSTQWTKPVQKLEVLATPTIQTEPLPPQAPALPFVLVGRYEEAGQTTVFLQHNEQNLVVRVGDTIAGQYKVESLKGSTLNLRYLPLNQPQSLEIGGSQ
jgi:hypothetical protein